MTRRLVVLPAVAIAVSLAGVLIAANFAGGGTPPPTLDRVSNQGTALPAPLNPRDAQALERMSAEGEVKLMGAHEGRAFYRFGPNCFGTGSVSDSTHRFGSLMCTPQFPSKARPLLDMTMFRGKGRPGDKWPPTDLSVFRSEGIAADGIASVGFLTPAGAIVGETSVTDNIYRHSSIPSEPLTALVALDSSGQVLHSVPIQHSGRN